MCRLYAMKANEPTRVECSLVHAQNALMAQSAGDAEGLVHGHGWGVADYPDGVPMIEKQTWAAFHGEHFAKAAAKVYAHTVVAHVRRATVGEPSIENTHPFHYGRWIFAHNGTVPNFLKVRDLMIPEIDPMLRNDIRGTTDSEHVFYYLLTLHLQHPEMPMLDLVARGLRQVVAWSREVDPERKIGLNIVLTDGTTFVGSRLGRTLWHLERDIDFECPICHKPHVHHETSEDYRAVEIASEPLSDENWHQFPDGVAYSVDEDFYLLTQSLDV
ncbi:class II glutamine amidotransferase [Thalassovita aquimarina]|uniref:class II glutamine amidotransferase n=1 Tax=Thalassovita aquimarina TaxID=2785917 RepID=UPI00356B3E5D